MEKFLLESIIILIAIFILVKIIKNIIDIRCNIKEVNLEKYNIELNTTVDTSIPLLLDGLIYEALENYLMINIRLKTDIINPKLEKQIRDALVDKVGRELSPILITKLSAYYNINSIGTIIAEKVYKVVMEYAAQSKNKPS